MKRSCLLLIILFSFEILPQEVTDSLEFISVYEPVNLLSTRYDKQINTFNLNSRLRLSQSIGDFNLRLLENFNSTYIRSGEKSIRDEQLFSLSSSYSFSKEFLAGFSINSDILSDNRKIEINQASSNTASAFLQTSPYKNVFISPFFGYTNNRQIGENDYGFVYGGEGVIDSLEFTDLLLTSDFRFRNEDISPRKNTLRFFNATALNNFGNNVLNNLTLQFSQNRKDFYYNADSVTAQRFDIVNNIQSREETLYSLQDVLNYNNFLGLFSQAITGRVSWRNIDRNTRYRNVQAASSSIFDTEISELRFEFESNTLFYSDFFTGLLRLSLSERDEKHLTKRFEGVNEIFYEERSRLESSKNNNATRGSISLSGDFNFSRTDKLSISLYQNKLRYDTPSNLNFDDRDEVLSIARVRYSKMLTPFFETFASLEGTYNHIVYILSERSSNNNLNRILRLNTGGNYRGKNITSANSFEVSANYTVYDFEDLNPNYRSFSFRQFTGIDSTIIKINDSFSTVLYGYIKLSEQGELRWASFATKPTRYLEEIYAEPKLVFIFHKILFSGGLRIFSLNSYNYKGKDRIPDSRYLSTGPVAEILISLVDSLYFRFYGWYEFISVNRKPLNENVNINMNMNWQF